ncbi:uncharacterized protein [Aegilops tauschii subsp. strangulata]|uniref:uncharacterized protein isoform X2 n=1 Tax=Aegilops tauschii subsp. strangulata TaxID=200361 RepID=UPI001ABC1CE9|nr:uncharacterized protein LOC109747955 isoform X1 [Aegilops tauschii subsp. strangulata]
MLLVALFSCVGDDVRVALPFLCCSAGEENPRPTRGFVRQPPEEEASHGRTSLSLNAAPSHPSSCSCRVLVAMPTVVERFVDWTVSWLPMYGEAKLLLVIYLWHPSAHGVRGTCTMASSIRRWRGMRPTSTGACLS